MSDNDSPLAKRKKATKERPLMTEGLVPHFTGKRLEDVPGGKAVKAIGGAVKKAAATVYPGARED